jgi:hypothetical protein
VNGKKAQALHPWLESATASPSDLNALSTQTWLTTLRSAKGTHGTGTAAGRRERAAVEQVSSRGHLASFSSWGRLTACSMRSVIYDRVIGLDIPRFAPRRPAISLNFTRPAAKKRPSNRPVIRLSIRTYQLAATLANRSKFPAGFAEIPAFPSRQSRPAQPQNARQDRIVRRGHSICPFCRGQSDWLRQQQLVPAARIAGGTTKAPDA